jgi:hypothetical protein
MCIAAAVVPAIDVEGSPVQFVVGIKNSFTINVVGDNKPILDFVGTLPFGAALKADPEGETISNYTFIWTPSNTSHVLLE